MALRLPPLPVALAGGAVGAWLGYRYLTRPGRSVATAVADLQAYIGGTVALSAQQQEMASIITTVFASYGLSWLAVAAVCNAYAESRLDPLAAGDGGHAIGLFQLNDARPSAAGYGMTVAARQDPATNAARMCELARGSRVVMAAHGVQNNRQLATTFARELERCAECGTSAAGGDAQLLVRSKLVDQLFPDYADVVPV